VNRLADFVLHHRKWVMILWGAMLIVGMVAAGKTPDRLTVDFSLPGQPGYETGKQIQDEYGNGGETQPYLPVATVPEGQTVEDNLGAIDKVFNQIAAKATDVRIATYSNTKDAVFITDDDRTTFAMVFGPFPASFNGPFPSDEIQPILDVANDSGDIQWQLTSYDLLAAGNSSESGAPSVLTETLLGALGALAVLVFLFASFLALVPLVVAAVSILTTFTVVLVLTYVTDVSFVVQFLIALVGLGVAIDYSLLIVTRWREEREHGRDNHEAVTIAMATAGRAVVASAGTVAISLVALLVVPVPLIRSMGLGGMLIPIVSTIVILTLLPALLGGIGPRVDWPKIRHENKASRAWARWAAFVVRRKWFAVGVAVVILGVLIAPVFGIRIGQAQTDSLASSGPAYEALQTLRDGGVPDGVVSPLELLMDGSSPDELLSTSGQVVQNTQGVDGIAAAFQPDPATWSDGHTIIAAAIPQDEAVDNTNAQVADRVNTANQDVSGYVGSAGAAATILDYIDAVYKNFPYVIVVIALVTFLLLARAFRSLVLPLKAVILNIMSVAATFGAVVWFWQEGNGSEAIFNISGTGSITFWLPVLIFAFLFGLSMDYEVFILSRMREEYNATDSTGAAVTQGLGRTGRLVTGAALILFCAFIALASAPDTDIKVFATALGFGILLDATVVRALLVPALVAVLGRWNWWLPSWAAKALFVPPHGAIREASSVAEEAAASLRANEETPAPSP
jgi:RND superfamily putative drug exporter